MGIIVSDQELAALVASDRAEGRSIAFANGCFDLIHAGHVRYLEGAKAEGDRLVVAVNDDASVRALKGEGRPILPAGARAELVAALRAADYVVLFGEATVERLLRLIRPDVHCKGTDYTLDTVPERAVVRELGGRIAIVGDAKRHNTGQLLSRIAASTSGVVFPSVNEHRDLRGKTPPEVVSWLARRRVALGFLSAIFAYWLARSTWRSIAIGLGVAALGELVRIWASGHLDKAREITTSGPYRYLSHPLYVGSCIMGAGFAIAAAAIVPALIVFAYLALTVPSAMITEEAAIGNLQPGVERPFSFDRVAANREYRAIAGFAIGALLLVLRMALVR